MAKPRHSTLLTAAASLASLMAVAPALAAPNITAPYSADYSITDLGPISSVPTPDGALIFSPTSSNTIWIGGAADSSSGVIDAVGVIRGAGGHITGFAPTSTQVSTAPNIDGGLALTPDNVALFTGFPTNTLGEIKPGSTSPDKTINLSSTSPPVTSSVGTLAFVPAGFGGAGDLKIASYNGDEWYSATISPDGSGTYNLAGLTDVEHISSGPEGIAYIHGGNPDFAADSLLLAGNNEVDAYQIDANGNPIAATDQLFVNGLTGVDGVTIDPQTGDFLFSTFNSGNDVFEVSRNAPTPEPATLALLALPTAYLSLRRTRQKPR